MFRLLDTYDPDANIYMGSPSPGRHDAQRHDQGTWFGNGGPGYVLSRGAMKTILNRQVGPHGRYTDSSLSTQYSELTQDAECCGDSVLGYVLWLKKIPMHGLYPMFTPFILPDIPFTEENWCYPLITLHKNTPKEMVDLFKWEFEKRKQQVCGLLHNRKHNIAAFLTSLTDSSPFGRCLGLLQARLGLNKAKLGERPL